MYEKYFGLNKSPFLMTPDPSALLLTTAHREALAGLSYGALNRKGFVVLTGEAGTGKTTLVRRLLQLGAEAEARCSVVFNPLLTPSEFLELLLINFGVRNLPASKALRLLKLEQLLNETHQAGKAAVLIVDEAHKLSYEVFEEIRLLTNFETSEQKLLQIVLSGQPELTRVLSHPNLWQLKQRIAVRLHIDPLSLEDVRAFIQHRWTRAGGAMPHPFTEEAISLIALWSQGIPRLVNSLCDNGLLQACSQQGKKVGADEVLQVIVDLDLPVPLPRIRVPDSEKTQTARAWSRQAALEFNGLLDPHLLTGELEEPKTEPEPATTGSSEQPAEADSKPDPEPAVEAEAPEVEKPIASAARAGLEPVPISDIQMAVGPKWNGRASNGNPTGHSLDRVRIRRVTRFEPETKETSLINRLFARLGIQGQKLA
jgi:general secretion pathway protein A